MPEFRIRPVRGGEDIAAVRDLLRDEAVPDGIVLLGRGVNGAPLGALILARADLARCTIRKLYVAPEGRGLGLGAALVSAAADRVARMGCRSLTSTGQGTVFCHRVGFRAV